MAVYPGAGSYGRPGTRLNRAVKLEPAAEDAPTGLRLAASARCSLPVLCTDLSTERDTQAKLRAFSGTATGFEAVFASLTEQRVGGS